MRWVFTTWLICFLNVIQVEAADIISAQSGPWSSTSTWVGGVVPSAGDNVIINQGHQVSVDGDFTVTALGIVGDMADKLTFGGGFFSPTVSLTVTSFIAGLNSGFGFSELTVQAIQLNPNLQIILTGSGDVIQSWGYDSQFANLTINSSFSTSSNTGITINGDFTISGGGTFTPSGEIRDGGSSTITIESGNILVINQAINGDGTTSSRFDTIIINGNVTTGSSGYINVVNFNLLGTGSLTVGFFGNFQTEGWWYTSNAPSSFGAGISSSSTISFNANEDQNIPAISYGSLTLSANTGTRAKTIAGTGTFVVQGDMNIATSNVQFSSTNTSLNLDFQGDLSNEGTWSSFANTNVRFTGSSAQTVSGGGEIDLPINLVVDNASGVTFSAPVDFTGTTIISGTGEASFDDVTISSILTSSSGNINVAGNFTNNNTFNRNAGRVTFNGSAAQSISGSATTGFNNMTVSNTSEVTVNSNVDLYNTFTLSGGGVFNASGSGGVFTVKSTAVDGDARIATLSNPNNFTGDVTVERFIDGRTGGDWRYLSIPVTGGNLGMWRDDFPVTGNFSDASPAGIDNVLVSSAPSVYSYDANADAWTALNGGGAATSSVPLDNETGYSVYTYLDADHTAVVRGPIRTGNVPVSIPTIAGRFNLIGNPYPSMLDGDAAVTANAGVGSTFYIRTDNTVFASYNASTNTPAGHPNGSWAGEISMGQSFWVEGGTDPSFDMTESMKIPNGNGQFLRLKNDPTQSNFRVNLAGNKQLDETVIIFKEGAADTLDSFDGKKFLNGDFDNTINMRSHINLSSFNRDNSLSYVFNVLDNQLCNHEVNLRIEDVQEGDYSLEFTNWEEYISPYEVVLVDNFAGNTLTLEEGSSYDFTVTTDTASFGEDRFDLQFTTTEIDLTGNLGLEVVKDCSSEYVGIQLQNSQNGVEYQLTSGSYQSEIGIGNNGLLEFLIDRSTLTEGSNTLSLRAFSSAGCFSEHEYTDLVNFDLSPEEKVESVTNGRSCGEGSVELSAEGASNEGFYQWYTSADATEPIDGQNSSVFLTPELSASTSYFVSVVNGDGCESERVKIDAEVVNLSVPEINIEGQTLISSYSEGNQWLKDGIAIENATDREFTINESGTYSLQITQNGCSVESEGIQFRVTDIDERLFDLGINIYPNPVEDYLFVRAQAPKILKRTSIEVFDMNGRSLSDRLSMEIQEGGYSINMNNLSPGFYTLNLKFDRELISLRLFKQ